MKKPKTSRERLQRALELQRNGRTEEAESLLRQVIATNAQQHAALFALGVLLFQTGRLEEARQYLERAASIESAPRYLTGLGEVLHQLGKLDLAAEAFGRILEREPDYPDARLNLATVLIDAGIRREAIDLLEEALARGPDGARLRSTLSWLWYHLHRPDQALPHAKRAAELAPDVAATHAQLADILDACGDKAAAVDSYRTALALDPAAHDVHSSLIVAMLTNPSFDAQATFDEARAWAARHAEPLRARVRAHENDKQPERRLRIGYVSPDFRAHAIQQFLVPLLRNHDSSEFEIFLYSSVDQPDGETEWYRSFAGERFRDIRPLDDLEAAEVVRRDRIDILVDLALHSSGGRLRMFACHPAPVQISWLGYPGTTGLDTIDYRITDPFLDPPGTAADVYSETNLHLPEAYWCYAPLAGSLDVGELPALAAGHLTFGSQNSCRKLHDGVLELWARVLLEVPKSRLFLHADDHAQQRLQRTLARAGVGAERVELGGRVSRIEYLRRYQRIDIGLDPFPFNGGTTTLDAAWMGVPVVTLSGESALQRAGTSIASNLGLPELVAHTPDDFVEAAARLAGDLARLSELRSGLRFRLEASALGDAPRFARHLEAAYRSAWWRYCGGAAHSTISSAST
ncbi:MAG: tetratricopeptide repeat protein [Myxococcota bacterium]|nr:tetratricopeptide repeat protein [Myxococcota bacterium]